MVVAVDRETGELRSPTPEEILALSPIERNRLNHSGEGLTPVHHPDGSISIDLEGRFQEFAIAHVGPDGRLHYGCVSDRAELQRTLRHPAPTAEDR